MYAYTQNLQCRHIATKQWAKFIQSTVYGFDDWFVSYSNTSVHTLPSKTNGAKESFDLMPGVVLFGDTIQLYHAVYLFEHTGVQL